MPPLALAVAGWLAWGGTLHWHDLVVLAITYTLTGLGVTVGYHRLFTHRSFKTDARGARAARRARLDGGRGAGDRVGRRPTASTTASPTSAGDPHSPHVDHGAGLARRAARPRPRARRLDVPRHRTWPTRARYAKDLLADRDLRFIDRTFPLWVVGRPGASRSASGVALTAARSRAG